MTSCQMRESADDTAVVLTVHGLIACRNDAGSGRPQRDRLQRSAVAQGAPGGRQSRQPEHRLLDREIAHSMSASEVDRSFTAETTRCANQPSETPPAPAGANRSARCPLECGSRGSIANRRATDDRDNVAQPQRSRPEPQNRPVEILASPGIDRPTRRTILQTWPASKS